MPVPQTLTNVFALFVRSVRVEESRWYTPIVRGGVCALVLFLVGQAI